MINLTFNYCNYFAFKKSRIVLMINFVILFIFTFYNANAIQDKISIQKEVITSLQNRGLSTDTSINFKIECLKDLTSKGFTLTNKSLKDAKNTFDSAVITLDLLEDKNLDIALSLAIEPFVSEIQDGDLKVQVSDLHTILDESIKNNSKNSQTIDILKSLSSIISYMGESGDTSSHIFNFFKSIFNAYKVCFSRNICQQVFDKNKDRIKDLMSSKSKSSEATASLELNNAGVKIGTNVSLSKDEGANEDSLYQLYRAGDIKIFFGGEINKILEAEVGGNLGAAYSVIYYSLEQYLDSKENKSSVLIKDDAINGVIKTREKLKKTEKLLLSWYSHIELFLKSNNIIRDIVFIVPPHITNTPHKYRSRSIKGGIEATASILDSVGITVRGTKENTTKIRSNPYLDLILDDCSAADNFTSKDIRNFFTKERYQSDKKRHTKSRTTDQNNDNEIYMSVKSLMSDKQNKSGILSFILGDLRLYNSSLLTMSNKEDIKIKKESRKVKHSLEEKWLGTKKYGFPQGRLGMLRSSIIVSTYMRERVKSSHNINLLKQIYAEIKKLSEMQSFSRKNKEASFDTSYKTKNYKIDGEVYIKIPGFKDLKLEMTYQTVSGSKIDDTDDIEFRLTFPIIDNVIIGYKNVSRCLNKLSNKTSNKEGISSGRLSSSFKLADDIISKIVKLIESDSKSENILGKIKPNKSISVNMYIGKSLKNDYKDLPLPQQEKIIMDRDKWILKYVKISKNTSKSLKVLSKVSSNSMIIMGDDTLSYIISRYNVFRIGLNNRDKNSFKIDVNYMWESFKTNNLDTFKLMFKNLASEKSNVRYELQRLFNDINNSYMENNIKPSDVFFRAFEELVINSQKFERKNSADCLNSCLRLLDEILDIQFNDYYDIEFNKLFSIYKRF